MMSFTQTVTKGFVKSHKLGVFYSMTPPSPLMSFLSLWPCVGVYSRKVLQLFLALLCIQFPKPQRAGRLLHQWLFVQFSIS